MCIMWRRYYTKCTRRTNLKQMNTVSCTTEQFGWSRKRFKTTNRVVNFEGYWDCTEKIPLKSRTIWLSKRRFSLSKFFSSSGNGREATRMYFIWVLLLLYFYVCSRTESLSWRASAYNFNFVCVFCRDSWLWVPPEYRHWHLENFHHTTGCQVSGRVLPSLSSFTFMFTSCWICMWN